MMSFTSFTNNFLIAMPSLADPNFFHSVTLICEHDEHGALGLIVNQPVDINFDEILQQLELNPLNDALSIPVVYGGPVQPDRGFVVHSHEGSWDSSLKVNDELHITTSLDILEALANGESCGKTFIALGYAGWGAGQLEAEMADNAWLNTPSENDIIFDVPFERRWKAAAKLLGVDLSTISSDVGHS